MKLNKTEEKIKEALLHKWAGLFGGSGSALLSTVGIAVINGRRFQDVEEEAAKEARRIYRAVKKKKK